jgi:hypothetical protein
MENSTFILAYLLTFVVCVSLTVGLLVLINKGLKSYFENLSRSPEIAEFFIRITNLIILLGGVGAALESSYNTSKEANWLTLTWNITEQLEKSMGRLFLTLLIFAIAFFILHLFAKKPKK